MQYIKLVELYEKLEGTSKRLEKTYHISEFLKKTSLEDIQKITLLLQGRLFPPWDERKIGVASRLVIKAINVATGIDAKTIEKEWRKIGDLGKTAEELVKRKKQRTLHATNLTITKVFDNMRKLPELTGAGTVDKKVKIISELLTSAKPKEARYIVRLILEEMRVGVGDGTLRDAIVWAFFDKEVKINYDDKNKSVDIENREKYKELINAVQHAYDVSNDFSVVVKQIKTKGIKSLGGISLTIGKPVKVMLFQKVDNIKEAFERVGKPAACEFKYDGFRLQLHKADSKIKLYTRRLEDVTKQFPDVVEFVKKYVKGKSFILDAEAVGYNPKTKKYLPFQNVSQRIKRKYDIEDMAKKYPVEMNVFDIISFEGKNMMHEPFQERRKLIKKIIKPHAKKIVCAKQLITGNEKDAEKFYKKALRDAQEGIMVKNLKSVYKPGSRVGFGVKVKPTMETLDLVIVGAEWGTGKRGGWLSSFVIACLDDGKFLEVGKVGTGFKELEGSGVSFEKMTKILKPLITSEKGRVVKIKPKIVIEIRFEEIQKSPTYSSGFALRFPRLVNLRVDKPKSEASTLDMIKDLYYGQKK